MPWIAHAGFKISNNNYQIEKDVWHVMKKVNEIEYRYRLTKSNIYHVIAGLYVNPNKALDCAKSVFVKSFYELIKKDVLVDAGCINYETRLSREGEPEIRDYFGEEQFFFWTKKYQGGQIGPGVFEVERSIDEFDDYSFLEGSIEIIHDIDLDNSKPEEHLFTYDKEAQVLFNWLMTAEHTHEFDMKIVIYCSILEHLASKKYKIIYKEPAVIEMIASFKESIINNKSIKDKQSIVSGLENLKRESSRKYCQLISHEYAKEKYGNYKTKSIVSDAYSARSTFAHGNGGSNIEYEKSKYIKYVVLDVVKGYLKDKELLTKRG